MRRRYATAASLLFAFLLTACGGTTSEPSDPQNADGPISVPEFGSGKADNYISTNAREFKLSGTAHADPPEGFEEMSGDEREEAIREAAENRLSTVSSSIENHIEDVVDEANGDGEDAKYFIYARNDNAETENTEVVDGRIAVEFELELVGSRELARLVAGDSGSASSFDVEVKDYGDDEGEMVTVEIGPTPSDDAFPKYDELFADGVYDIAVHFGGDYNEERYDIETAKWAFQMLKEDGWNHSAESFEDLGIDSGPFTKRITVEGEQVEARVYLYHANMVDDANQEKLVDTLKTSFAERDVVIYSGHAGAGSGFILDYDPKLEVLPRDFGELPLADKYQIYVFDGCRTYRTYVQDLMEKNDRKSFENLDVVTTVNTTPFSAGYQVIHEFVYWLTITDDQGRHFPLTWSTILQGVNTEKWDDVHYGVHGIDQDPELNPHASDGVACRSCDGQGTCGVGGNYCLQMDGGGSACGVACATSEACGEGFECVPITEDEEKFYVPKQCMPTRRTCGG